jgi:hypothetical protein
MNRLSPRVQGKAFFAMNSLKSLKDSREKQKQHKHGFLGRLVERFGPPNLEPLAKLTKQL